MAIYSLSLRSIGRSTHAAGTAGAHLRYISRKRAASEILTQHMPEDAQSARTWMDQHERSARKNARLADKIMVALPRELDAQQRADLVRGFMDELTQGGRVPYYAAIHQTGKDEYNPHAHICVVDRDIETGKRVLCLSDSIRDRQKKGLPGPSAVEWVRERWETCANKALEHAGHEARIDRRSLEAQGVDRAPQIHIGPRAQHIDTMVERPVSKPLKAPTRRHPDRVVDYPFIDAGRSRRDRNAEIIDLNLEKAARSVDFETRVWAQFEKDQRAKDRPVEAKLIEDARRHTVIERRLKADAKAHMDAALQRRRADAKFARAWVRQNLTQDTARLKARQAQEAATLKAQQGQLGARLKRFLDFTGKTKAQHQHERQRQRDQHLDERHEIRVAYQDERQQRLSAIEGRYSTARDEVVRGRKAALKGAQERRAAALERADDLLQRRAAEREQAREAVQAQIANWKSVQKAARRERPDLNEQAYEAAMARIQQHDKTRRAWERMSNEERRRFLETTAEREALRLRQSPAIEQKNEACNRSANDFGPEI